MQTEKDRFLDWLAGFIDGEGNFHISEVNGYHLPRFGISIRADDWEALVLIQRELGMGRLRLHHGRKDERALRYDIARLEDSKEFADLLDGRLRAKKRYQFALWKEAVELASKFGGGRTSPAHRRLVELKQAIIDFNRQPMPDTDAILHGQIVQRRQGFVGRSHTAEAKAANADRRRVWWASDKGQAERLRRSLKKGKQ